MTTIAALAAISHAGRHSGKISLDNVGLGNVSLGNIRLDKGKVGRGCQKGSAT
ncbi:MAG TPA: hypothetical protein VGC09_16155 [Rhodopila sp.]